MKGHRKVNVIYVVYIRINLLLNRNEDMLVIIMGIYVKRNVVDKFCVEINEEVSERRRWC